MNPEMTKATQAELLLLLGKLREIQDKLRASEAREHRLRRILGLLGVSDTLWGAAGSPPGSPQYPPPRSPQYSPTGAAGAAGAAGSPPYSLPPGVGRHISPENSPRAQAAAGPPSLEEFDAENLKALESNVRAALARVKLAQERLEALEAVGQKNKDFCCPITGTTMRQPVMIGDGNSYEQKDILEWFGRQTRNRKPFTSPLTRKVVSGNTEINLALRNVIAAAVEAELKQRGEKQRGEKRAREP